MARIGGLVVLTATMITGWLMVRATIRDRGLREKRSAEWSHGWLRRVAKLLGWRITFEGRPPQEAVLLAPNHMGYADVAALGSVLPCHFVAKADVLSWPVIGFLFDSTGHIGVVRKRDAMSMRKTNEAIASKLKLGASVCVFLEGTSTGGDRVLPFRAPLIQPALDAEVPIMPVAIQYLADRPGLDTSEDVAYWKDHVFGTHLWRLVGLRGVHVHVRFGDPVSTRDVDRKQLAVQLRENVATLSGLPMNDERGGGYASPLD